MSSLQRIFMFIQKGRFSSSYKKAEFPICPEVAFGPRPWESQSALRHSNELPQQNDSPPAREEGPPSALADVTDPRWLSSPLSLKACHPQWAG